jgi:hypothetical protein
MGDGDVDERKSFKIISNASGPRPNVWKARSWHRGGFEFWRLGPRALVLSVHQPHGPDGYWRMYCCSQPIVRSHDDRGIFGSAIEAITALDKLAALDMQTILLD